MCVITRCNSCILTTGHTLVTSNPDQETGHLKNVASFPTYPSLSPASVTWIFISGLEVAYISSVGWDTDMGATLTAESNKM